MGKHSEEMKSGKTKIIIFIFVIFIIIALIIMLFVLKKTPEEKAIESIVRCFKAIKMSDVDSANKYINYDELVASLDAMIVENRSISDVEKELFKDINWNIKNIKIEDNKAMAEVEIINKNFENIITEWMKQLYGIRNSEQVISDQIALEKLENILEKETESKSEVQTITLHKEKEDWKIDVNEELRNLMYPGIDKVISVLNEY